jgi:hypothetical protein
MGGVNSGRRRSVHRGDVEHYPAIDLRVLRRARVLRAGECTYTTLQWGNQAPEALSARIFIDLSDTGDASMRILRSEDHRARLERVAIECVPCPYGGHRYYFLCPLVGVRCEQLFLADGIFASRKAHKLTYASQSEDQISRARRKVRKLHRQVEGDFRYARPRGRNRWHAVQSLKAAKNKAHALYLDRLRALIGDIS